MNVVSKIIKKVHIFGDGRGEILSQGIRVSNLPIVLFHKYFTVLFVNDTLATLRKIESLSAFGVVLTSTLLQRLVCVPSAL